MAKKRTPKPTPLDSIQDPELRLWAEQIRLRRSQLSNPKTRPYITSHYNVDGEKHRITRKQSEPTPIAKLIKPAKRKTPAQTVEDIKLIRETWQRTVGPALATETRIYAFKKGILTIEVLSSSLLQEIRQFHSHTLFSDLSDIWNLPQPLIKITYRLGKK